MLISVDCLPYHLRGWWILQRLEQPGGTEGVTGPTRHLVDLLLSNRRAGDVGVTAVCSAHELVIDAALSSARSHGQLALVEATCNQVNQSGGYTGLTPFAFAQHVRARAQATRTAVVLGGDHLGPQPWRALPADEAMAHARTMVAAYVEAGFTKIHLDCSMRCADDPAILSEQIIAERAADLAAASESMNRDAAMSAPVYVIGTEVPPPGGMGPGHHLAVSDPARVAETVDAHRAAFRRRNLDQAIDRVIAVVVQPGVDFGNEEVVHFQPASAAALSLALPDSPPVVFEAHSTDFQRPGAYAALVAAHFAILKVGPAATFALREALYGLAHIEDVLTADAERSGLRRVLDDVMRRHPDHWKSHYTGGPEQISYLRNFSLSDRIRYYWQNPEVDVATRRLMMNLERVSIPRPLISQYLPRLLDAVLEGGVPARPRDLLLAHVRACLEPYAAAAGAHPGLLPES
ncbi:MAG: class II D-tagatose-bisphosphate aldolase, non-catalytic subunit [Vicinamibacterales bacterium]